MVSGESIEVNTAVNQLCVRLLDKVTRGKIPLAENLLGILRDVLYDIVASGFVILINGNTGGIAIFPVRHIVDRLAAICGQWLSGMGIAGAFRAQIAEHTKAVEVNSPVLVKLRDKEIAKAIATGLILQKRRELALDEICVIAVNFIWAQRPSEKMREGIAEGDVSHFASCTSAADLCGALRVLPFSLRWYVIGTLPRLPAGHAEDGTISNL